jgi:non-specific serine/threonine protein kinase
MASLERFAGLLAGQNQPIRAARLLGATEVLRTGAHVPRFSAEQAAYDHMCAAVRAQLDEATFAAARAEGRAMSLDQAVAEALSVPVEVPPAQIDAGTPSLAPQPASAAPDRLGTLTARERQVLALVAQGASNRAIADALVIAERTAEIHVSNILSKLGVTSRTQAAAYALAQGLADAPDA